MLTYNLLNPYLYEVLYKELRIGILYFDSFHVEYNYWTFSETTKINSDSIWEEIGQKLNQMNQNEFEQRTSEK